MEPIVKASVSFPAKFWWDIVRPRIRPTLVDNTLTLERAILVASILAGYDTDWAHLIIELIHEAVLKRSTSVPFLYLIYKLYLRSRVEILH